MYVGIDLGTSGVKAILLAENGRVIASQNAALVVSRPHPLWSEQTPLIGGKQPIRSCKHWPQNTICSK